MYVHKTRRVLQPMGHGRYRYFPNDWFSLPTGNHILPQETWSFGHRPSLLGKGGDEGGPFRTQKVWIQEDPQVHSVLGFGQAYEGTLHLFREGSIYGTNSFLAPSSSVELDAYGTTAIARTIPTNPMSSAAVAVGELRRDGLPAIIGSGLLKSRARDYRKIGDEYLNVEFGWRPLIADLRSFATSMKSQNKILAQLHRDNGKNVRRRLTLTNESSSTYDPNAGFPPGPTPFMCNGVQLDAWMNAEIPGRQNGTKWWSQTSTKRWFSGSYTYHLPDPRNGFFEKIAYYEAQANVLLGTRLTPEVVWNLAPWSWAADWFSNAGDVIHNISQLGSDGLVLRYGYLMEEKESFNKGWCQWAINTPAGPRGIDVTIAHGATTKVRTQATPYGFGIDIGGLTARQTAITAALGISRGPRVAL